MIKTAKGNIAERSAKPVTPSHLKADKATEPLFSISINTGLQVGARVGQRSKGVGKEEHPHQGDNPGNRHCAKTGAAGHILRQIEGAAPDHRTNDDARQQDQS
jgi:hypothetical protein